MKNNKLPVITAAVTILYCCLCFVSSGCILYGAFYESNSIFQFGNSLVYFWIFNPIAIILSVIGLIQTVNRKSLLKVDIRIILLGIYYVIVIVAYVFFEIFIEMLLKYVRYDGIINKIEPMRRKLNI